MSIGFPTGKNIIQRKIAGLLRDQKTFARAPSAKQAAETSAKSVDRIIYSHRKRSKPVGLLLLAFKMALFAAFSMLQVLGIEKVILLLGAICALITDAFFCDAPVSLSLVKAVITAGIRKKIDILAAVLPHELIKLPQKRAANAMPLHAGVCDE